METRIVKMTAQHWPAVSNIYKQGIETGYATFEQEVPDWLTWHKSHRPDCRFVAMQDTEIVGWAALSNVSERCIYAGVCEVSVYVTENMRGKGIGRLLLEALIEESEKAGIWTLQAGIFSENTGSIKLHNNHGFRLVGVRERIGKLNGIWRDVQLLEKRSFKTGL